MLNNYYVSHTLKQNAKKNMHVTRRKALLIHTIQNIHKQCLVLISDQ